MAKKTLSAALARKDAAAAKGKVERLREAARSDIALVLRRKTEIAEAFFDIGQALTRLKEPAAWRAMGRKSFAELCAKDLSLSATRASELMDIVALVPRDAAIALGQERAGAVSEILRALPPQTPADTRSKLSRGKVVQIPGASRIDPLSSTVDALHAVAKTLRHASKSERRGRSTTSDERVLAEHAQALLRKAGFPNAKVEALATRPGRPSNARISSVAIARLADVGRALAKVRT